VTSCMTPLDRVVFSRLHHHLLRAMWDQVDVTSVFSIQMYESYKHFYVLNRLLELGNYRPVSDAELWPCGKRIGTRSSQTRIAELARYMISEHFAAYYFLRASRQAREPVLAENQRVHSPRTNSVTRSLLTICWSLGFVPMPMPARCLNRRAAFSSCGIRRCRRADFRRTIFRRFSPSTKMHRLCGTGLSNLPRRNACRLTKREQYLLNLYRSSELHGALLMAESRAAFPVPKWLVERLGNCATEATHGRAPD